MMSLAAECLLSFRCVAHFYVLSAIQQEEHFKMYSIN
jgi:hypothetical protein